MKTPLIEYLEEYIAKNIARFDTPGHKAGLGLSERMRRVMRLGAVCDMTLPDEAGQWLNGCVFEAEGRAAQLWGAKRTHFCYNGTTVALQAVMFASVNPGDKVIVAANCHRSVMNGLVLCGAEPVYVKPRYSAELQLDMNVSAADVALLLAEHDSVKAVIITNPTYFGVGADIRAIANIAHEYNIPIIVDEAHGAHWRFSAELPDDALSCGADAAAQSTHKMLAGLSQASMLHIGTNRIDAARTAAALKMLQTSSPNYLLLASLDAVRADMQEHGREKLARVMKLVAEIRAAVAGTNAVCYNNKLITENAAYAYDASKITIDFSATRQRGKDLEQRLLHNGVMPEMCDHRRALFHITVGDNADSAKKLIAAVKSLAGKKETVLTPDVLPELPCPQSALTPREAFYAAKHYCAADEAVGAVSAGAVCFYPPGIPVLLPGCIITKEAMQYIKMMESAGFFAEGWSGPIRQMEIIS